MTTSPDLGAWLRQQREQRSWTRADLARRIIQAARDHGDTTMPVTAHLTHNLYRWERGTTGISERYRLYCAEVLGLPPGHLQTPARPAPAGQPAHTDTLVVIMIILPEGTQAQVKIASPGTTPPPGPAASGLMTASLRPPRIIPAQSRYPAQSSHPVRSRARGASDVCSGIGEAGMTQDCPIPSRRTRYPP